MKITSPIFLQQASNVGRVKGYLKLSFDSDDPILGDITGNGDITVTSIKNGEKISNTYSSPDALTISVQADAYSEIVLIGDIRTFANNDYSDANLCEASNLSSLSYLDFESNESSLDLIIADCPVLTGVTSMYNSRGGGVEISNCPELDNVTLSSGSFDYITIANAPRLRALRIDDNAMMPNFDISGAPRLQFFDCRYCASLTELDLSENMQLTTLSCEGCEKVNVIHYNATQPEPSSAIANLIRENADLQGIVYTDRNAPYFENIESAAIDSGWTIEQL